jgi:transcriptional regulator with XRE-family HTH domain
MEFPKTGLSAPVSASISSEIEDQLTQGQIYQGALTGLQHLTGERPEVIHTLLRALNREAIQTTLQYVAQIEDCAPLPAIAPASPSPRTKLAAAGSPASPPTDQPPQNPIDQKNQEYRQMGQQIKQIRQRRRLTQGELASRTLVPVIHIQALEAGQLEKLPEDVYLRGFLRRLGQALDLQELASLTMNDPKPENLIPSWYNPSLNTKPWLSSKTPLTVYAAYIACITGIIGGYGWVAAGLDASVFDPFFATIAPPEQPTLWQSSQDDTATPPPQPQITPPSSIVAPVSSTTQTTPPSTQ